MSVNPQREARRQQLLLRTLWRDEPVEVLQGWLRKRGVGLTAQGLTAYRGNAGAIAERALASAFPTLAALVGGASFAAMARDFWQHHPPTRGDLGEWGAALPDFVASSAHLVSEPYLADCARLDWLVHLASRAADSPDQTPALDALAEQGPEALQLSLRPGCAVLASDWPVASLWHAHQPASDDGFAAVRTALTSGRGEHALVVRDGWAVRVHALDVDAAAFTRTLIAGTSLAGALDAGGEDFDFESWLVRAVQLHWLHTVQPIASTATA